MRNKISILFTLLQLRAGGSEKLAYNLIAGLDRSVFEPSVVWFQDFDLLDDFKELSIPLYHIKKGKGLDFSVMQALQRLIGRVGFDIVNPHHFTPLVYAFLGSQTRKHTALVYTEHSSWEVLPENCFWKFIKRKMLRRCDAIIGVAEEITTRIHHLYGIPNSKLYTIHNGVNIDRFMPPLNTKYFDIASNEGLNIVMVANFRANKNHLFLVNSFKDFLYRCPNTKLVLVGQGFSDDSENTERKIRDLVNKLCLEDKVTFLGYKENVHEILPTMDIACLTSHKEGLPVSLIEAMATGLPVVGTNVEGIRDVVVHGYNGLLVEPDNRGQLSDAFWTLTMNNELRTEFGKKSREIAVTRYSLQICVEAYQKVFLSVYESLRRNDRKCSGGTLILDP